jgi:hypothetical protein
MEEMVGARELPEIQFLAGNGNKIETYQPSLS